MKTKILNYQVIVSPDEYPGGGGEGYTAYCPTLGVADDGDTVEEALANVKGAIEVYVGSLVADGEAVPTDNENMMTTLVNISTENLAGRPIIFA